MAEEKKDRAESIMSEIAEFDKSTLRNFIEDVTVKTTAPEDTIRNVPLNVFEAIFLPFVRGEVESTNEQNYFAHWAGLVGATSPAHVCDVTGKKLFTVPPLMDSSMLDNKAMPRGAVMKPLVNYSAMASTQPQRAVGELAQALVSDVEQRVVGAPKYSWDEMLKYYGVSEKKEVKPHGQASIEDDFS